MTMEIEDQAEEQVETTLREDIESAVKEVSEKAEKPVEEAIVKDDKEKTDKVRDEAGKFKSTDKKPKEETAPIEDQVAKPESSAPNTWTPAAKAKWKELPPEIQAEVAKREAEVEKGFTRLDEERTVGKSFKEVVSPYLSMIQSEGSTPIVAVQSLLNTAYKLRQGTPQQKGQLIMELAQTFGAELPKVSQSQPHADPQLQAIQQELATLKNERQRDLTSREQQEQAVTQSEIDTFASNPEHVHFETVKAYMASLLKSGLTKGGSYKEHLKDAYDQAVWMRPDIRSTLLEQQTAEKEAKRVADAKEKAEKARKASVSISGSPGATAPSKANHEDRSLREELEANLAAARSA